MSPRDGEVGADGVTPRLSELARTLLADPDEPVDPARVVRAVRESIPRADHVGLTLFRRNQKPQTVAGTSETAHLVDRLQHDLGEGPCLDAARGATVVVADDLSGDERWPAFGPRCAEHLGVRSVLSIRLPLAGEDTAALSLCAGDVGAFTEADVAAGPLLSLLAALALESMLREQDVTNLEAALDASRQIGRAVGIVMARELVTSQDAFERLRRSSQNLNRKLRDVAAEVEDTGSVPSQQPKP